MVAGPLKTATGLRAAMVDHETDVLVIGDGPAGLSAALMLAKNGRKVQVYGENETGANKAMLHNYLGIREIKGTEFVAVAREQAKGFGAELNDGTVQAVKVSGAGFTSETSDGKNWKAKYVLVATAKAADMAQELGAELDDGRVFIDRNGRTRVDNLYAAGSVARGKKSQVAISVGDGAAAAIDIMSREKGKAVHDWDIP